MSFEELSYLDSDRRSGDGDKDITFGATFCFELDDLLVFSGVLATLTFDLDDFFEEEERCCCFERRLWPRLLELELLLLESPESELPEEEPEDPDEDDEEEDEEDEDDELEEERERFFLGRLLVSSSLADCRFLSSPPAGAVVRFLAFSSYSSWWDDLRFLLPLPLAAEGSSRRADDLLVVEVLGRTFFTGVESRSGAESSSSLL